MPGRLVPTEAELARAEGRDYEPAVHLLDRILAERRARWESQEKRGHKYKEPCRAGHLQPAGAAGGMSVGAAWARALTFTLGPHPGEPN